MADGQKMGFPSEVGLAQGAVGPGVEALQRYLSQFGYIERQDAGVYAPILTEAPISGDALGTFDQATVDALQMYQGFHNLPLTGVLDEATVAQMSTIRCGVPDINDVVGSDRFVVQGNRWRTTSLGYRFQEFAYELGPQETRDAITTALRMWSDITPLTFIEHWNPEILIRFVEGDHGDGEQYNGAFAHAFYPPPKGGRLAGDAHFNEGYIFAADLPIGARQVDLVTVAAHEFGHSLGLGHSTNQYALMWPYYSWGTSKRVLHGDDIEGIQSLYGANPGGIRVIPNSIDFGDVHAGDVQSREFTLGNNEHHDVTVTFPEPTPRPGGVFFWNSGTYTIAPGQHMTVSVDYSPPGTGVAQKTLSFTSNAPGSLHSINLRGRGIPGPPP